LCLGRNCSLYDQSFYYRARREQEKAHILVANHHLLFAHIAAGGNAGGVLPAFDALVIDEAHGAEDVAASYLGIEFSNLGAAKLIELLASRRSNRTVLSASKIPHRAELEARLHDAANEAREATARFFENLQLAVRFEPNRTNNVRITRRNLLSNELYEPLERLESVLKEARREADGAQDETLLKEIDGFMNRCAEMRKASARSSNRAAPDTFIGLPVCRACPTALEKRLACRASVCTARPSKSRKRCASRFSISFAPLF
jgi:Rad3-related DNA helicase